MKKIFKSLIKENTIVRRMTQTLAIVLIAMSVTTLTGCTDDDEAEDPYPMELLNNWLAVAETVTPTVDGVTGEATRNDSPNWRLDIRANGTAVKYVRESSGSPWREDVRYQWGYANRYLVLAPDSETRVIYYVAGLSDKVLGLVKTEEVTPDVDDEGTKKDPYYLTTYTQFRAATSGDL